MFAGAPAQGSAPRAGSSLSSQGSCGGGGLGVPCVSGGGPSGSQPWQQAACAAPWARPAGLCVRSPGGRPAGQWPCSSPSVLEVEPRNALGCVCCPARTSDHSDGDHGAAEPASVCLILHFSCLRVSSEHHPPTPPRVGCLSYSWWGYRLRKEGKGQIPRRCFERRTQKTITRDSLGGLRRREQFLGRMEA